MYSHYKTKHVALLLGLLLVGCTRESSTNRGESSPLSSPDPAGSSGTEPAASTLSEAEHGHAAGSHGGVIIPIGADSYHAEAIIEKSGSFRLITLGQDETRIQEVDVQQLRAYVKGEADADAVSIDLVATPQEGDSPGKTSQFIAQLPETLIGKAVQVTIPNLNIQGERFRIGFTTAVEEHADEMPSGLVGEEERRLYLTPGGKYTAADIEANGNVTASQKYKGMKSDHNAKPQPGDRICPISMTKANPEFAWIIDGKSYLFCCPPCIDEFLTMAKESPDELRDPETYVK
jgi:YHS domain-containing protein